MRLIALLVLAASFSVPSAFAAKISSVSECEGLIYATYNSRQTLHADLEQRFQGEWERVGDAQGEVAGSDLFSLPEKLKIKAHSRTLEDGRLDVWLQFDVQHFNDFLSINEGYAPRQNTSDIRRNPNYGMAFPLRKHGAHADMVRQSFDGKTLTRVRFYAYGPRAPFSVLVPVRLWQYVRLDFKVVQNISASEDGSTLVIEEQRSGASQEKGGHSLEDLFTRVTYRRVIK